MKNNQTEINTREICKIAIEAGLIIMKYHKKISDFERKDDDSEVTIADREAGDFLCENLKKIHQNIPTVSEENSDEDNQKAALSESYFLIDPLDGTKNFIKGAKNFTVNIALIKNKKSCEGFIYLPAKDILYFTENGKSYKVDEATKSFSPYEIKVSNLTNNITFLSTLREPESSEIKLWAQNLPLKVKEFQDVSSSYKFCLIAQGDAEIYPRKIHIKTWDIAAGEAIVKCAGGEIYDFETKKEIIYQENFNAPKFIASNGKISFDEL